MNLRTDSNAGSGRGGMPGWQTAALRFTHTFRAHSRASFGRRVGSRVAAAPNDIRP